VKWFKGSQDKLSEVCQVSPFCTIVNIKHFIPFKGLEGKLKGITSGVRGGAALPRTPLRVPPPERLREGTHGGGSFNITSACISLPQVMHSGVPRGAVVHLPPLGVPKIQN